MERSAFESDDDDDVNDRF